MKEESLAGMFIYGEPMYHVLPLLLKDQTTAKNIVWATDTYASYGEKYAVDKQMFEDNDITLIQNGVMLPRILKTQAQQKSRTKDRAEVYTPSWVCNKMNNEVDAQWFGKRAVFNVENTDNTWTPIADKIEFATEDAWKAYVTSPRLELTCGEAPYLVSRYDATTGEHLDVHNRIGLLDRKLRVVNENVSDDEWFDWVCRAYESVYGYEYQGDSLFFARINLVQTFIDYYEDRFGEQPNKAQIKKIATIVSWNLWQMDGFTDMPPFGVPVDSTDAFSFIPVEAKTVLDDKPLYCRIKDWQCGRSVLFHSMQGKQTKAKKRRVGK